MTTCSVDDFPFKYFDTNGDVINGTLTNGSCIFPDANCGANLPASGCCDLNKDFVSTSPGESIMAAVNNVWLIPMIVVGMGLWKSMSEEEKEELKKEGIESQPKFIRESKLSEGMKKFLTHWWYNGIFISIIGAIFLGIWLKRTEQSSMTTVERTSLMSAEAFFDPFYTAFTFVDDIIMIRVTYALANNDKLLTNRLIHMGLVGVTITGIAGGIVATILGLSQTTLQLLTNPGRENDLALYPGCEFIGNVDTNLIVPYWMMEAWGCWGQQIGRVFAGFLTGAGEIALMGWIGSIGTGIFAAIWFPNYRTFGNPLTLLGIAEITMDWLLPMIYVLVLVATPYGKQIGERTGLELSFQKFIHYFIVPSRAIWRKITNQPKDTKTNPDNKTNITASKAIRTAAAEANAADYSQGGESEENKDKKVENKGNDKEKVFAISDDEVVEEVFTLVKQGIALMFVDLVSLAAGSATTFLALNADNAVAYQLTALASELPNYGLVATGTMVMMLKLLGPYLLGNHDPKWFVQYCYLNLISSVVVVGFVLGCTFPFLDKLAFNSGKNACAFATSTECLPYFNEVMGEDAEGGRFTLFFTYYVFGIAGSIAALSTILRGILLTLLEFDYCLKVTIIAAIAYIPAICVVQFAPFEFQKQAIAYFSAALVPPAVMIILFFFKVIVDLRKVANHEPGPWSVETKKRKRIEASIFARKSAVLSPEDVDAELSEEEEA